MTVHRAVRVCDALCGAGRGALTLGYGRPIVDCPACLALMPPSKIAPQDRHLVVEHYPPGRAYWWNEDRT